MSGATRKPSTRDMPSESPLPAGSSNKRVDAPHVLGPDPPAATTPPSQLSASPPIASSPVGVPPADASFDVAAPPIEGDALPESREAAVAIVQQVRRRRPSSPIICGGSRLRSIIARRN